MSNHPCIKEAKRLIRAAGLNVTLTSALSFRVCSREYNARPLFVDIHCSAISDNLARFEVSRLYSEHSEYTKAAPLHNVEFTF